MAKTYLDQLVEYPAKVISRISGDKYCVGLLVNKNFDQLTDEDFDKVLDEFDQVIGLNYLKCLHINDSKNPQFAHKDRHENIGHGFIGFDNIISIIYNKRVLGLPMILETPYINKEYPPYKEEIEMIRKKEFLDSFWK